MTKTMTKQSHSHSQAQLKIVCDKVCDNIEGLCEYFNLEYRVSGNNMITMCCPIHGGDNTGALNLYAQGDEYRGNWKCRTHGCEKTFKGSVLGLIRGIISRNKYGWSKDGDDMCPFAESVEFALSFINEKLENIKHSNGDQNKQSFTSTIKYIKDSQPEIINGITREYIRKSINIPSKYYLDRQYSVEILDKYDIGLCNSKNKEMYNRIVVPIYDNDYKHMVGCSGRSIFEKCSLCSYHHDPVDSCPSPDYAWQNPKWKHSKSLKSKNHLYNFWFAKKYILETATAIIVESPGNVWRLEENGIHNSVAIFGSSFSDRQKMLLDASGAMSLVILTDSDEAGRQAAAQIKEKCQNTYRIFIPKISKNDVGEMNKQEIKDELITYLESIK